MTGIGTYGAVFRDLAKRFGGMIRVESSVVGVGAALVTAVGFDSERVSLTMINLGATVIYLDVTQEVSATRGIRLAPNGGNVAMNVAEDAALPAQAWYAYGSGAGGTLYVLTGRREAMLPQFPEGA